ncbi:MAG: DMT family transporter [Sphingobacteriales bacterium]|nr:DMT family transporter [Sphingobacteriales bacterium]
MKKKGATQLTVAGFIITFFGSLLFSTKAIIVKKAFAGTHIDPLSLLSLRMLFSLPFYLGAVYFAYRKAVYAKFTQKQWVQIIILGLFGYYISSLFDFLGLQYISAGLERLILFLYPTFCVLINAFYFRQKVIRIQQLALLLTYSGIAIAYYGEMQVDINNPHFILGSLLIFLCSITYAIYIVGSGRVIPQVGVTKFTAYAMLASTTGVFAHYLLRGDYTLLYSAYTGFWTYGLLLAIIATVIPSFMISSGLKQIGSNNVAIISSIGPVSTIIQAHYILGEKVFTEQIIGTVLVIAGVLLIGWKSSQLQT